MLTAREPALHALLPPDTPQTAARKPREARMAKCRQRSAERVGEPKWSFSILLELLKSRPRGPHLALGKEMAADLRVGGKPPPSAACPDAGMLAASRMGHSRRTGSNQAPAQA